MEADGDVDVSCIVRNIGDREGDEVVQLYTSFSGTGVVRPVLSLRGFKRVSLMPGECRKIVFHLSMRQLGYYDENMNFVVEPGKLQIKIGNKCKDFQIEESIEIIGEKKNVKNRRVYTCQVDEERI